MVSSTLYPIAYQQVIKVLKTMTALDSSCPPTPTHPPAPFTHLHLEQCSQMSGTDGVCLFVSIRSQAGHSSPGCAHSKHTRTQTENGMAASLTNRLVYDRLYTSRDTLTLSPPLTTWSDFLLCDNAGRGNIPSSTLTPPLFFFWHCLESLTSVSLI